MQDYDLMIRAAWMYYNDDLTHAQIARKLHLNRVKVTRLLQRAREQGIVEIRVAQPLPPDLAVSRQLENHFGLQEAVVVTTDTPDGIGQAAADMLMYLIERERSVGFGWSSTVSQLANYLPPQPSLPPCTVVDLVGSMLGKGNPYSVSGRVAGALKATLYPLAVPVMVSSTEARETLIAEPSIHKALEAARACKVAFIGVGEVGATSTMVEVEFLTAAHMQTLERRGAVGEMLLHYFGIDGKPIASETDERVIGLTLDELRAIPNVVLVARGTHKTAAILGALRSGIPQTLITDMETALSLLSRESA